MTYAIRASVYETEYREERDLLFLLSFISSEQLSVLEVPCGAGRLSCKLVPKLNRYTIMDQEPNMVKESMRRLTTLGWGNNVKPHIGNLIDAQLGVNFDLIIIPRESMQLLKPADMRKAIINLGKQLVINSGNLVVDLSTFAHRKDPDYFLLDADENWHFNWNRLTADNAELKRWSRQISHDRQIDFYFRYELTRENKTEKWKSSMTLYKYDLSSMQKYLPTNLRSVHIWGDYDKSNYHADSPRLILVFKRI